MALVTGGSGGIGRAICLRLAADGAQVAVHYRTGKDAAQDVVEQIVRAGGTATAVGGDVSDAADAARIVDEAIGAGDRLDILVNNAGATRNRLIDDMVEADWLDIMRINLGGVFNCTRAAASRMRGGGSIINVSSIMSVNGWRGCSAYSMSKAAINAFTRSCAIEYARFGLRVNAVLPGFVETDLVSDLMAKDGGRGIRAQLPTRRSAPADEVADVVAYLAQEGPSQLTGALLPVDGGATATLLLGHPNSSAGRTR
ncbi:SDR family NAD(P)-dependent oxidoreductase [Sinomonas mesophila]|uniref:SDR family NAD(P)-dependent oxidoreductase n=1 Tax=Sinomonas mesophila TaxID=1531955 RepID=UPI001C3766DF|nr:SDR family oxidoreductase [Sinomonas mesophila]